MTLDRERPAGAGSTLVITDGRVAVRLGAALRAEGRHIVSAATPEQALAMMRDASVEGVLLERAAPEFSAVVLDERARLSRELDGLTYAVSHDLQAPLRSVDGFSAALAEHLAGALDPKADDYLGRVRGAALRMSGMIDGLLQLSRLGRVTLAREQADLSAIAARVASSLATAGPALRRAVHIQPGLVAEADRALVTKLFEELLGNSWKFTAKVAQPVVEVGAVGPPGGVTYYVRDNGEGFDPADARKLFRPFQRFHRAGDYPGRGLGLALAARIVDRHAGAIRVESAPAAGTTVHFTLPGPAAGGRA